MPSVLLLPVVPLGCRLSATLEFSSQRQLSASIRRPLCCMHESGCPPSADPLCDLHLVFPTCFEVRTAQGRTPSMRPRAFNKNTSAVRGQCLSAGSIGRVTYRCIVFLLLFSASFHSGTYQLNICEHKINFMLQSVGTRFWNSVACVSLESYLSVV